MEITPGRAPFSEDEDYTPLRKPKSVTTTPTHGNTYGAGSLAAGGSGSGGSGGSQVADAFGRTVSPSKLSPFAKEFVPRFGGAVGGGAVDQPRQQHFQQQHNYQQYQSQSPQQRYANGYQQSQQQAVYAPQITSLTASVQDRLKIAGGPSGSGSGSSGNSGGNTNKSTANNYYQPRHNKHHHYNQQHPQQRYHNQHQQQQQQQQQQHHHQHHNQQQQHHHHNQHQHHNHNKHHHQQHASAANASPTAADMESIALDYLQTVIQCLNQNPGQFDTIATRFLTIFDGMENNQYVLSNAMEDIFQESIQHPNFRYMGAKLYNLLHMLNLKKDSLFQTLLKCKLDYHQQEVLQFMQTNQQQKVRETALFLAELYMQLRGDDSRIHLIAENIVYSLKQLLSKESTDNVRCICLTLKLAGYDLTADCPLAMQQIIAQLDSINVQSPGKYSLAANVISLQKNNWGRKVSSSNSLSDPAEVILKPPEPLRTSDEPVFYGPDGRELTAEEAEFLSGDTAGRGDGEHDDDGDMQGDGDLDVDFDPEMDEETEQAYKEFCKLNASI